MFCIEEEGKFQVQNQRKIQTQTQYSILNTQYSNMTKVTFINDQNYI